jgi:peptidoglycan/LPS O-acetylase OafA/YrhL
MATVVVFSHSFPLAGYMTDKPLHRHGQDGSLGDMAVGGFFVLSGFLIGQSWDRRRGFWRFVGRRVRRIVPGYVAAAAVTAFAVPAALGLDVGWASVWRFLGSVPRLWDPSDPAAFAANPYPNATNGSLWTIPYEFRCYLLVAALGAVGLLASARFLVGAFVALVALAAVARGWETPYPFNHLTLAPHQLFRLTAYFLVGALAYRWRGRVPFSNRGAVLAAAAMLAAVLVRPAWNLLMPLAVGYLTFWLAFHPRVRLHGFARRGDFSYGIYLYAFPIQQFCVHLAGGPMSPLALFAIAWPLSVAAGALSWYLIERPFLPAGRRPPPAAAAADRPFPAAVGPMPAALATSHP